MEIDFKNGVAIENARMIKVNIDGTVGASTCGNDEILASKSRS